LVRHFLVTIAWTSNELLKQLCKACAFGSPSLARRLARMCGIMHRRWQAQLKYFCEANADFRREFEECVRGIRGMSCKQLCARKRCSFNALADIVAMVQKMKVSRWPPTLKRESPLRCCWLRIQHASPGRLARHHRRHASGWHLLTNKPGQTDCLLQASKLIVDRLDEKRFLKVTSVPYIWLLPYREHW
jgi:hypothetical protein